MKVKKPQLVVLLKISQFISRTVSKHNLGWYSVNVGWVHNQKYPKKMTVEMIGKQFSWEYSYNIHEKNCFTQVISTDEWCCFFKTEHAPRVMYSTEPVFLDKAFGNKKTFENDIVLMEFMFQSGEFGEQYKIDMHFI